jgi:SAM-dependent methyltransferase
MAQEPQELPRPEFDAYATDYGAGMDVGMKRCLGSDAESFIEVKVAWMLRYLACCPLLGGEGIPQLLDYGCGAGALLRTLRRMGFAAALAGCDVSGEMLKEARKRWPPDEPLRFDRIENGHAPYADEAFDIVVLSAVMHHVKVARRNEVYADALRLLRIGGRLIVFEHNPFNPVTQWVVRHTPIDQNAVLLRPCEVVRGVKAVGSVVTRTEYLMFFPPRLTFLRPSERFLRRFPLGAQYVVVARKVGKQF